jgi:hypothetical protein
MQGKITNARPRWQGRVKSPGEIAMAPWLVISLPADSIFTPLANHIRQGRFVLP